MSKAFANFAPWFGFTELVSSEGAPPRAVRAHRPQEGPACDRGLSKVWLPLVASMRP